MTGVQTCALPILTHRQLGQVMLDVFVSSDFRNFSAHERLPNKFQNRGDRASQNTDSVATNVTNSGIKESFKMPIVYTSSAMVIRSFRISATTNPKTLYTGDATVDP